MWMNTLLILWSSYAIINMPLLTHFVHWQVSEQPRFSPIDFQAASSLAYYVSYWFWAAWSLSALCFILIFDLHKKWLVCVFSLTIMVAHGRMLTNSCQITEVKQRRARLVLGWVTTTRVTLLAMCRGVGQASHITPPLSTQQWWVPGGTRKLSCNDWL